MGNYDEEFIRLRNVTNELFELDILDDWRLDQIDELMCAMYREDVIDWNIKEGNAQESIFNSPEFVNLKSPEDIYTFLDDQDLITPGVQTLYEHMCPFNEDDGKQFVSDYKQIIYYSFFSRQALLLKEKIEIIQAITAG